MLSTGGTKHANDTSQGDMKAVRAAIEFMKNSPPEPFAIFLPTRGAHPPYGSPLEFAKKWSLDEIKSSVELRPTKLAKKPM